MYNNAQTRREVVFPGSLTSFFSRARAQTELLAGIDIFCFNAGSILQLSVDVQVFRCYLRILRHHRPQDETKLARFQL